MNDVPITAPFCVFEAGAQTVYLNLCEIEAVISNGVTGSVVSMKSGADIMVDESPNQVMSAILLVSDTSRGREFREGLVDDDDE